MIIRRSAFAGCVVLLGLSAAGCAELSEAIDPENRSELQGAKAPPLSLPPDYNLRPPVSGGRGSPDRKNVDVARQSLFGVNQPGFVTPGAAPATATEGSRSAGEAALLSKATANTRNSDNIRSEIDEETQGLKASEDGFVDKVLKWDEDAGGEDAQDSAEDGFKTVIAGEQKPVIKRKGTIFD